MAAPQPTTDVTNLNVAFAALTDPEARKAFAAAMPDLWRGGNVSANDYGVTPG